MIRVELVKLLRRPRTWLAIGLLCALPVLVAAFVAARHLAPAPGRGPAFLSAVLNNGSLYPAAAMAMVVPIFLPIAVAVLAGDAVAGEATGGTLRYLLARPVGRTRLLVAKLIALTVFVLLALAFVVGTSYTAGVLLLGTEPRAAVGALAVLITSDVLLTLDAASAVQPYLPTRYWLAFVDFFRDPIFWRDIDRGLLLQGCYVGLLLAASWANFMTKDVTS